MMSAPISSARTAITIPAIAPPEIPPEEEDWDVCALLEVRELLVARGVDKVCVIVVPAPCRAVVMVTTCGAVVAACVLVAAF